MLTMIRNPAPPMAVRAENLRLTGAAESFLNAPQVSEYNDLVRSNACKNREQKLGPVERGEE